MDMHIRDPRKRQQQSQKQIMGRSEIDGRCRRHPEHRNSKGVCPFCLRERLSQLSASSSATTTLTSSATPSFPDSNRSSAASSPPNQVPTNTSRLLKPGPLKKSRSLAFVMGIRPREEDKENKKTEKEKEKEKEKNKKRKKKGGFWSKLVIGSERRKEVDGGSMLHSRTIKEKTADKWALF